MIDRLVRHVTITVHSFIDFGSGSRRNSHASLYVRRGAKLAAPDAAVISTTWGYHPAIKDAEELVVSGRFAELLVFGARLPDVIDKVGEARLTHPPTSLPTGVYWFSQLERPAVLVVYDGGPVGPSVSAPAGDVAEGSALDNALSWFDHAWEGARVVPTPAFAVGEQVVLTSTGGDGVVMEPRRFVVDAWNYDVFSAGSRTRIAEQDIVARPMAADARAWVQGSPVPPARFASTLTRAKLEQHFSDTVYSFRATRTVFRPYQFKPVLKLLNTGSLRLLIADEVGLGKTIEAGLVWTEMEARRQANRVLVVCPSALVSKWRREMEERFGFELIELDHDGLEDLIDDQETGRIKVRASYICSIERLRTWANIQRASDLDLTFDLVVVDEAHSFRNSDTKSYALGEHLTEWAEALVMLSATPINLRTRDLYNLLTLLAPGEFEDEESLLLRVEPNVALNKVSRSLTDPAISNVERSQWLSDIPGSLFGQALALRPDYRLLVKLLAQRYLTPTDAVQVKRLCVELNSLSTQITRTRKVEVQEKKPLRVPQPVEVIFDEVEAGFYNEYFDWCKQRAEVAGTPLNFAMQMPLRLAGSCLPQAARSVLEWTPEAEVDYEAEEDDEAATPKRRPASANVPPSARLIDLARELRSDTKFDQFTTVIDSLRNQRKQAIVFTFSRRSLRYLQQRLLGTHHKVRALHGDVPRRDRDKIMADFRNGDFDLLLATKVASEGLDFEFCSAVINYDLPWNPMEIEQRIGRIDRIGQVEDKLAIWNFNTPGTIEEIICERVHLRIGVFERTIGELEPILESKWRQIERLVFDFSLSELEREQKLRDALLAVEEQARSLEDVEAAAPSLISSDGADIDGLERDLTSSGRYIGQSELAHLVTDWAETFGGAATTEGNILTLHGTSAMADHLQSLVPTGERTRSEVVEYLTAFRSEQPVYVCLDQEEARRGSVELLTASHALTRAATRTPGYRRGRFAVLQMRSADVGMAPGSYLTLLSVVRWSGLRPSNEVWTSSIDLSTYNDAGENLGAAVMKSLAEGTLEAGPFREYDHLEDAVEEAIHNLQVRVRIHGDALSAENAAFLATRRTSLTEVHERRLAHLLQAHETNVERGTKLVSASAGKLRKAEQRFAAQMADLDSGVEPTLQPDDLAVCVVEVRQ